MTKREMNIKVLKGEGIPEVFFQPSIEWWYWYNRERGTLPERYREMELIDVFDDLDVSIRYIDYFTGLPGVVRMEHSDKVKVKEKVEGDRKFTLVETHKGELITEWCLSTENQWRILKHPIGGQDDIEKAIWLYENTNYFFVRENFERGSEFFGERGSPSSASPGADTSTSPFMGWGSRTLSTPWRTTPRRSRGSWRP
ncbi:MAG TPA: hypothetical protein EYP61_09330 [Candidatus Latescibacteria bacterium]|nr:hypothetical protein [Candidatus Latescibacterota bacterium]